MTMPSASQVGAIGGRQPSQAHATTSYLQLSDLRIGSKRKRAAENASDSNRTNSDSHRDFSSKVAHGISPCNVSPVLLAPAEVCADCVVDCDDADCPVSSEEQCTDQCIVIPCGEQSTCSEGCTEDTCEVEHCDGGEGCMGSDESLPCCTDYQGNYEMNCMDFTSPHMNWDCSLDELLGVAGTHAGFSGYSQFSGFNSQICNIPSDATLPAMSFDSSNMSSAFTEKGTSNSTLTTPSQTHIPLTEFHPIPQEAPSTDFSCRWLNCNASFRSLSDLVGHVNLIHLHPPSPPRPSKRLCVDSTMLDLSSLSCRWDDCHIYPDLSALPGPSTGLQPEMAFDLLSSHLFHDHLGLSGPALQSNVIFPNSEYLTGDVYENLTSKANNSPEEAAQVSQKTEPSLATPESSPPPISSTLESSQPHDCTTSAHVCQWQECGASFDTCAALTDHLTAVHVGSGKGHYDCHWGDCARWGDQGFMSKQKIMRHLQAHTGHRPFTCAECGQHFSEAATLQQHMRRHKQEKPFVCDVPGCGKAFAITGALTIHKRTHNGERPFKCPHCDRAFAESSNLSKHLRTHTGDKPHRCPEPGCGKAFARPDQLQRHGNVHTKKKDAQTSAESSKSIAVKS